MSYRVEMAASGRAVCVGTECKNNKIKIGKDDLRLGVWVEFQERGSWMWRHWGCVTGKILENIRKNLDPEGTGNYEWDRLDGYDGAGAEKNSLDHAPEYQEKVKRCVTQGFIDPEDFNGDPEMNKLGEKGLRTPQSKKKIREDTISKKHEIDELREQLETIKAERDALLAKGAKPGKLDAQLRGLEEELEAKATPKKKPATKKRGATKMEEDDDEEEKKPAPKKRATKVKKEIGEETNHEEAKPASKKRVSKVKKEADEELGVEDIKPVSKKRAAKVKKEDNEEVDFEDVKPVPKKRVTKVKREVDEDANHVEAKPARSSRAKKVLKKYNDDDDNEDDEEAEEGVAKPARKPRAKKVTKKEANRETDTTVKEELVHEESKKVTTDQSADRVKQATEQKDVEMKTEDTERPEVEDHAAEVAEKKPKKGRARKSSGKA